MFLFQTYVKRKIFQTYIVICLDVWLVLLIYFCDNLLSVPVIPIAIIWISDIFLLNYFHCVIVLDCDRQSCYDLERKQRPDTSVSSLSTLTSSSSTVGRGTCSFSTDGVEFIGKFTLHNKYSDNFRSLLETSIWNIAARCFRRICRYDGVCIWKMRLRNNDNNIWWRWWEPLLPPSPRRISGNKLSG